jgi:ribosomal-protein-alanine N-acetyltransferase
VDIHDPPFSIGCYRVDPMLVEDVPAIMDIERVSFAEPWPAEAYQHEVLANPHAHYVVIRDTGVPQPDQAHPDARPRWWPWSAPPPAEPLPILGFAGLWLLVDEAHISTIAAHPQRRGEGLGELLLAALLERAFTLRAAIATLEVRVSNAVAQRLYVKYEFVEVGRRKHYYRNNGEDALIMTVPALDAGYRERLTARERALAERLVRRAA